jgi:hypothetical protein
MPWVTKDSDFVLLQLNALPEMFDHKSIIIGRKGSRVDVGIKSLTPYSAKGILQQLPANGTMKEFRILSDITSPIQSCKEAWDRELRRGIYLVVLSVKMDSKVDLSEIVLANEEQCFSLYRCYNKPRDPY